MEKLAVLSQFIRNNKFAFLSAFLAVFILIQSLTNEQGVSNTTSEVSDKNFVFQKINSINYHSKYNFAGEGVPMKDNEVVERLDRELLVNTYWQSSTLLSLKLADKYFPIIEPILAARGIPNDFKYIALIESGLRDVSSPSGASGKWQIMKETGKQYGMVINDEVDERYNVEKSTIAACRYFQQAFDTLGTWTAAAASYNIGISGLKNRMREQHATNYYDMWLTSETSRYVFRAIAVKEIFENPKQYGYYYGVDSVYRAERFSYVTEDSAIPSLAEYAEAYGLKYKQLKMLNPWLRSSKLTNKERKVYEIKIFRN
jgi:membrane-bound lytic murein transglycosylase D